MKSYPSLNSLTSDAHPSPLCSKPPMRVSCPLNVPPLFPPQGLCSCLLLECTRPAGQSPCAPVVTLCHGDLSATCSFPGEAFPDPPMYSGHPLLSPVLGLHCPGVYGCFVCLSVFLDRVHLSLKYLLPVFDCLLCLDRSALWKASSWRTWQSCLLV